MKHNEAFLAIVNDAKSRIRETDVDSVKGLLEKAHDFHLIDVREDNEWEKAHIKGAIHLGKGVIERDIEGAVPDKDTEIILYCGGGFRSALAADSLQKMGYTNAISMDGGFGAWMEKGYPIE